MSDTMKLEFPSKAIPIITQQRHSNPSAIVTTDQEILEPPASTRYCSRRDRVPRYRCGTCDSRDCTCNHLIQTESSIKLRGVLMMLNKHTASSMNLVPRYVLKRRTREWNVLLHFEESTSQQYWLTLRWQKLPVLASGRIVRFVPYLVMV